MSHAQHTHSTLVVCLSACLSGWWCRPSLRDGPMVKHHLPVAGPRLQDGLGRADTCCHGVASRTKPVVLWRAGGSGPQPCVCGAVDGAAQDLLKEQHVTRHHGCRQVVRHPFAHLDKLAFLSVLPLSDHLHRPEQLPRAGGEEVGLQQRVQRHQHCRRLHGTILLRDLVVLQRTAAKQQAGTGETRQGLDVVHDVFGGVGEHWRQRQLSQASSLGECGDLVVEASTHPVLVRGHQRLRRTLLARHGVCVLVALPGHVLGVTHIGTQYLPVEARVLCLHATLGELAELLRGLGRACELHHAHGSTADQITHHRTPAADEVDFVLGESAEVHEPDELLDGHPHGALRLDHRLVAHHRRAQHLHAADL
mmetsp:Transcript_46909/g.116923  ORF Transcript_46909/g.116923 Transcript_46909/m.116923 type:complete len:365 (-) Transcript_46909:648-1742(-)